MSSLNDYNAMSPEDELDAFQASLNVEIGTGGYNTAATTTTSQKRKNSATDIQPNKQPKVEKKAPENRAIYVTNIPRDATMEEVMDVFKKYGMIDQGVDGKPRVKMYTDDDGSFNGEALIVYFKKESVDLAIHLQDDYELRLGDRRNGTLRVQEADNTRRKNTDADKIASQLVRKERKTAERNRIEMQRKLADWSDNEEEVEKIYAPKKNQWAKVCIIKNVFQLHQLEEEDEAVLEIKQDMREAAEEFGTVTKVVLYDKEPEGIVTVRFTQFDAAERFCAKFNGRRYNGGPLQISIAEDRPKFKKSGGKGVEGEDSNEDDKRNLERYLQDEEDDGYDL